MVEGAKTQICSLLDVLNNRRKENEESSYHASQENDRLGWAS